MAESPSSSRREVAGADHSVAASNPDPLIPAASVTARQNCSSPETLAAPTAVYFAPPPVSTRARTYASAALRAVEQLAFRHPKKKLSPAAPRRRDEMGASDSKVFGPAFLADATPLTKLHISDVRAAHNTYVDLELASPGARRRAEDTSRDTSRGAAARETRLYDVSSLDDFRRSSIFHPAARSRRREGRPARRRGPAGETARSARRRRDPNTSERRSRRSSSRKFSVA